MFYRNLLLLNRSSYEIRSIDNNGKRPKIFAISKIFAIFVLLNMANLLLVNILLKGVTIISIKLHSKKYR